MSKVIQMRAVIGGPGYPTIGWFELRKRDVADRAIPLRECVADGARESGPRPFVQRKKTPGL